MRIVRARFKVLFLLAALLLVGVLASVVGRIAGGDASTWINTVGGTIVVIVATRVFRVPEEDIEAPRPLWRLTGRPTAGFVLGILALINGAAGLWIFIYEQTTGPMSLDGSVSDSLTLTIVSVVITLLIGVLYLRSSIRLARVGAPEQVRQAGRG